MYESTYRIDLKETSESFYFLPLAPYPDALLYLTSMAHEYTLPSYYVERFNTDVYMIHYTLNGGGQFVYNGISYPLEAGTLVFAYLGVHNILFPTDDRFEYCAIHVNGAQIQALYNHATEAGKKIVMPFPQENILSCFGKLKESLSPSMDFFSISKELNLLLTDILQSSLRKTNTLSPLMHEVYKLIVNNTTSVTEIARKLNYSPVYLEKRFKKESGSTIQNHIIRHKLEQAEHLLLTTSLPVSDIAKRIGYANTVGLVHLFRKHHDCTPLEFRKEWPKKKSSHIFSNPKGDKPLT